MKSNTFNSAVRTIGTALVIAAVLMTITFPVVIHHIMADSSPFTISLAIWTLSPVSGAVAGLNMFFPAIVILGYLGVSLWLATILHDVVDQLLTGLKVSVGYLARVRFNLRRA